MRKLTFFRLSVRRRYETDQRCSSRGDGGYGVGNCLVSQEIDRYVGYIGFMNSRVDDRSAH